MWPRENEHAATQKHRFIFSMNERPTTPTDYISDRPQIYEELFKDSLLAETGLPSTLATLQAGMGEVGLAGYHLQHRVQDGRLPYILRPIVRSADGVVTQTLERHNNAARHPEQALGAAAFAILTKEDLHAVASITARIMSKWSRTLFNDGELLLPDRQGYRYRQGLTEEEATRERHAKAVIIELAAAIMEVYPLMTQSKDPRIHYEIESVIAMRGPEFMHQWMSRKILRTWLAANDRLDELEQWENFAQKTILMTALRLNIEDPLSELVRLKTNADTLIDSATATRTGWSAERIANELPPGLRKRIAITYPDDPMAGLELITSRLDQVTHAKIEEYTGWPTQKVKAVFKKTDQQELAVDSSLPITELVLAIAQTYEFLETPTAVASFLNWQTEKVETFFTKKRKRQIAIKARPVESQNKLSEHSSTIVYVSNGQSLIAEAARRFDLLFTKADFLGWTEAELTDRISEQAITYLTIRAKSFEAGLTRLKNGIALLSDTALATRLDIDQTQAKQAIPWTVRQHCIFHLPRDPLNAIEQWWRGERRL